MFFMNYVQTKIRKNGENDENRNYVCTKIVDKLLNYVCTKIQKEAVLVNYVCTKIGIL